MDKLTQEKELALSAIQKKLVGKKLNYKEIFALMDEVAKNRLGDVLTTYFAASGYSKGFTNEELYFLTKAMVETGEKLHFKGIVADKHSIGGVPGTRNTIIVVPIIAAAGFTIPKSSSRAITTSDGTADAMEILAPVSFSKEELYKIVEKTKGCIVWGGSFNIAPADDILIQVEKPLMFESYDKILVSIMAKKIAFGSNHIVIDLPYGETVKVHRVEDAIILKDKFEYLAKKFDIKITVFIHHVGEPAARGVGPILEVKDCLRILEQHPDRSIDLENRALNLSTILLDLCLKDSQKEFQLEIKKQYGNCKNWAKSILTSGAALKKLKEIIAAQGGNQYITSQELIPGKFMYHVLSKKSGVIRKLNNENITSIAKILGAPKQKGSGIFLNKKLGESVMKNEKLYTIYSESMYNLKEAKDSLKNFPISYL